jgi:hypothetical protein
VTGTLTARARTGRLVPAIVGVGLVLLVTGTFLPWLRSGAERRNSYRAGALIHRVLAPAGPEAALLTAWPLLAVLCAAAVAGYAVGLHRSAFVVAAIASAGAGTVAFDALTAMPTTYASVISSGPAVTLAGAALGLVGALTALLTGSGARRSTR